jgi:endogenous inhibitor of DNA gyrase (YacG/DUF329 family)
VNPAKQHPESRCPVCEKIVQVTGNLSAPFCSPRCKQLDLGRWLNEDYGLPIEPEIDHDSDSDSYS